MIVSGNQSLVQHFSQSDISYLIYDWNHKETHTYIYIYSACLYSSQLPLCENKQYPPKIAGWKMTWRTVEGDYGWKAISSGDAETKKRNLSG